MDPGAFLMPNLDYYHNHLKSKIFIRTRPLSEKQEMELIFTKVPISSPFLLNLKPP